MQVTQVTNISFGWNVRTHISATELAVKDSNLLNKNEKRMLGRFSQMPDFLKEELQDMNSAHFYDVLSEDPSFGIRNDIKNNALSKFLEHTSRAFNSTKREDFIKAIGFAVHYLQDASTPPHTEHGNYLHKLYRLPMHILFEKGKKLGTSNRLEILNRNYTPEEIPFSTLKSLFHNTALFTVQRENKVNYKNINKWFAIQQRCYNRTVNASKAYLNYMLQYIPKQLK